MNDMVLDVKEILTMISAEIPESVLKNTYLPLIIDPDPGVFNKRWILEVAGTAHNRVAILDAHNKIIGTVPPLRTFTRGDKSGNLNFNIGAAQAQIDRHAVYGNNLLSKILSISVDLSSTVSPELQNEWRQLLIKYGYEKYVAPDDKINGPKHKSAAVFIEIEDW